MHILKEIVINWRERRLISKLCMDQSDEVRLDEGKARNVKTGRGSRQGYCLPPILFNSYGKYLTSEALGGFGDFKMGGQLISTVKYADDLVLLAKEETVLQGMIDKLIKIVTCCGMEINVEKNKGNENLKATSPSTDYDRSETIGECGIFHLFGQHDNKLSKMYTRN